MRNVKVLDKTANVTCNIYYTYIYIYIYNHVTHTLSSADISISHRKSATFAISRNTEKKLHFNTQFLILLTFLSPWRLLR